MLRFHAPQEEAVFTVPGLLLHISENDEQILSSVGSSQKTQGKDNWRCQKGESLEPRARHGIDDSLQDLPLFFSQFCRFKP